MPPMVSRAGSHAVRTSVLAGTAMGLLGAMLPWIEIRVLFGSVRVIGAETNPGKLTLAASIFAGLLTLAAAASADAAAHRILHGLCLLPGVTVVFIAVVNLQDVDSLRTRTDGSATIGLGLWVTLLAGFAIVAGAVVSLISSPPPPSLPPAHDGGPPPPLNLPGAPQWDP